MKKYLLGLMSIAMLTLASLSLASCFGVGSNRNFVIENSDIKYEKSPTTIRSKIDIDGYWCHPINNNGEDDCLGIMFWEDGTFAWSVNIVRDSLGHIEDFVTLYYGVYKISGDTIEANYYWEYSYLNYWDITKVKFLILNRNCIKQIYSHTQNGKNKHDRPSYSYEIYNYVPLDTIPPADNKYNVWRKYDWLWRDSLSETR